MKKSTSNLKKTELAAKVAELEAENQHLKQVVGGRRHWWGVGVLLTIGALALALANVSLWANRLVLNTDRYVETITPLVHDPDVQAAVQKYAYTEITKQVDFKQVTADLLPPKAEVLAGPISQQLEKYTNEAIGKVVQSDRFANVWVSVNKTAHTQLVNAIKRGGGDGELNVSDLYTYISSEVQGTPLQIVSNRKLPAGIGQIKVLNTTAVKNLSSGVTYSKWVFVGLLLLAILSIAGAILLAPRKWLAGAWAGGAVLIAMALSILGLVIGRSAALAQIHDSVYRTAGSAAWGIMTRGLYHQIWWLVALAVIATAGSGYMLWRQRSAA